MNITRHGLSIGIERIDGHIFLSLKAIGKLTHQDYETITPMVDSALQGVREPVVRMLFDASELRGWELRAAWDDFKLGLKHGGQFERVAIFGAGHCLENLSKICGWFISGEVQTFETMPEAVAWLQQA